MGAYVVQGLEAALRVAAAGRLGRGLVSGFVVLGLRAGAVVLAVAVLPISLPSSSWS
ncbi:hypothetical protein HFP70_35890 [Streptomyces sp. ARC14]|uniref:hypothetical protein n=1 Tax=Streptomyces sp. ARC14 TaxID=2724152 RepID=UPI0038572507